MPLQITMRKALCSLPLALLFLASVVPSNGQKEERLLVVAAGEPLVVECGLRPEQRAAWRRDGGPVPADLAPSEAAGGGAGLRARLAAAAARPHHAGLYECAPNSQRIRVRLAGTDPAPADDGPASGATLVYYDMRGNLTQSRFALNCSSLAVDRSVKLTWIKNETTPLEDVAEFRSGHLALQEDGTVLALTARGFEVDYGNYTCSNGAAQLVWEVRAKPHLKLPTDTGVVEGQKLKLTCKVTGRPYPEVEWFFSNVSTNASDFVEVKKALGDRAKVNPSDQGVVGAELVVDPAAAIDAGWFKCATASGPEGSDMTLLRVKDMYAALWPFLGICVEVFLLCAIILIYEKRRTKPELDDSDTDNHDQKKS